MSFMPFQILGMWFRPLLSLVLLGMGIFLVAKWCGDQPHPVYVVETRRLEQPNATSPEGEESRVPTTTLVKEQRLSYGIGLNRATAMLLTGLALTVWVLGGGWVSSVLLRPHDSNPPVDTPSGIVERINRPDGTQLHVECFGLPGGIPLILTHGWGLDRREWVYARKELSTRCRIIVWDLPGLGESKGPSNNDWSLEKLAGDLDAVIRFSGSQPVILAGHSIGGMIILTYCRLFSTGLSARVGGLVIGQSTFTNPVETTSMAWFYRMIQKPVLEPLCHLMVALAPIVWLLNWCSYLTGSIHRTNHKSFFSGKESREQLGFISRYGVQSWPAVVARGFLSMFRFDATETLSTISVPSLIVGGEKDVTCKPDASVTMSKTIPDARLVTLATARHGGVFEFHQQFAEAIHAMISTSLSGLEQAAAEELSHNRLREDSALPI